ncbi:MAG: carboxypeptidase M32 [Candidatus Heimdallarchaeaceae archaeon]
MKTAYDKLLEKYEEIQLLSSISGVLYWDMNTYMPSGAVEYRAKQFQYISKKAHQLWTDPEISLLIEETEKSVSLNFPQKRNVELMKRWYEERTIFPSELVEKLATQSNRTLEIWKKAKAKTDFKMVLPEMEKLFTLNLESSELLAQYKGKKDPFDALIDSRDKGFSVPFLTKIFDEVKAFLIPFVQDCMTSSIQPDRSFFSQFVERNKQVELVKDLASFLEYDFFSEKAVGRIDEVEHPLTIGCGFNDVRVTVKYHENNVLAAFLAGAHECGHALHALQGRPEWYNQPIYRVSSPSFGESQSRFLENIIVSSEEFWEAYLPRFKRITDGIFSDVSLSEFYASLNAVNPGFIRIQADEVTYILHIIIRFEIEKELFAGNIEIKELPIVWNQKYKEYLDVEVPNDALGVMQDLHWYSQYYGYFYGYGIGDIISSQISHELSSSFPEWLDYLKRGQFTPIRKWLAERIHLLGGLYDSLPLVEKITGEPLTAKYFIKYIKRKYKDIYQI